jgi:putative ABC transport system permease protein
MPQALRRFWRTAKSDPWYSLSVVFTIGLGIGISTSAFTVLDRLVLRDPPGVLAPREIRRIVVAEPASPEQSKAVERTSFSYPEIQVIAQATAGLGAVTSYWNWPDKVPIRLNTEVLSARILGVSTNYFDALGVAPLLGRMFSAPSLLSTGGGPAEVVVSAAFWERALGRRPDAIGTTVDLHHQPLKVVGVAAAGFDGLGLDGPDIWIPAEFVGPESYGPKWREERGGTVWAVVMRKLPGARDADILQRVQIGLMADAERQVPQRYRIGATGLRSLQRSLAFDFKSEIRFALALWAVSLVVLVTTAINAGSLFLVHGFEQQRNTAVALALGGRRAHIVGSRVAEGLVLALVGAVFGVLLSKGGSEIVRVTLASFIHYSEGPIDYRPLAYAVLLAMLIGAVASALPALRATRIDLKGLLDEGGLGGGREVRRLTTFIHCVQLGFAVVVLYGAALFVQSGRRARATPLGMELDNVVEGYAFLAKDGMPSAGIKQYWERVSAELLPDPGVETVALTQSLPFKSLTGGLVFADNGTSTSQAANWSYISPDYTKVLRMQLLAGRELSSSDVAESEPVALINRTGAAQLWGGRNPLGSCVHADSKGVARCIRVVGVVENSRRMELNEAEAIQLFIPMAQAPAFPLAPYFLVRARPGMRRQVIDRVRRVLAAQAPSGTQIEISMMSESIEGLTGQWVRSARLLTLFGLLAGLVTFVGIYGSMTYDLLRRRRELGIRLALGARPAQLTRGVVRAGLRWSLYGLAAGSIGAVWLAIGVRALLYGTTPLDAGSLVAAIILVLSIGSLAAWLGARRAAVRDPVFLLRNSR